MSLQVWLPLNGDLHNQGLSGNLAVTTVGTVAYDNAGKIGKCFISGGTSQVTNGINIDSNLIDILNSPDGCSIALWVKPVGNHVHYNGTFISSGNWNATRWSFGVSQNNSQVDVLCQGHNNYITCSVPVNEWTHLVGVFKNGVSKVYKNGQYVGELTGVATTFASDASNTCIGRETYASGYFGFNGRINDVRIYNHALSPKEVEEIAKGLVLHYKLDNYWLAENLLINTHFDNRYAQTTGWDTSKNGTLLANSWGGYNSGVANQATVYHAHLKEVNGEYVYEFIKDVNNSWLGISQSGLQSKLTAGQVYTFSWEQYCVSGSNYVNTGLYYYKTGASSANFHLGYAYGNSGRVIGKWQKFTYTFTAPSDADYAKNMSWYVYGAQGGNGTFYTRHFKLEKGDKATPWCPAKTDTLYTALGYNGTTIYDSSGYANNGTIVGSLTAAAGSPRYGVATYTESGNTDYIQTPTLNLPGDQITLNFWFKSANQTPGSNYHMPLAAAANSNQAYEMSIYKTGYLRGGLVIAGTRKVDNCTSTKLTDGSWHMCTMTYDGAIIKRYVDAVMEKSTAATGSLVTSTYFALGHYGSNTSYYSKEAYTSDVRIYTTALTEAQVAELYNTSATIDKSGNVYAREFKEQ